MRKALYVGYVAVVISVLALIWRFSPVVYEVNATVSIRPGLYAWDNDKPSLRVEQAVRSQVGLLESEGVIRTAIGKVGAGSLSSTDGWFPFSEPVSREDRALIVAKRNLNLRFEPFTDLIRIAFRHGDQMVAAPVQDSSAPRSWEQRQDQDGGLARDEPAPVAAIRKTSRRRA